MNKNEFIEHLEGNGYSKLESNKYGKIMKIFEGGVMTPQNSITMVFIIKNSKLVYKYQETIRGKKKTHKAKLTQLNVRNGELNGLKAIKLKNK